MLTYSICECEGWNTMLPGNQSKIDAFHMWMRGLERTIGVDCLVLWGAFYMRMRGLKPIRVMDVHCRNGRILYADAGVGT